MELQKPFQEFEVHREAYSHGIRCLDFFDEGRVPLLVSLEGVGLMAFPEPRSNRRPGHLHQPTEQNLRVRLDAERGRILRNRQNHRNRLELHLRPRGRKVGFADGTVGEAELRPGRPQDEPLDGHFL